MVRLDSASPLILESPPIPHESGASAARAAWTRMKRMTSKTWWAGLVLAHCCLLTLAMGCKPSSSSSSGGAGGELQVKAAEAPAPPAITPELEALKAQAEGGSAEAQYKMGKAYFKGEDVAVHD